MNESVEKVSISKGFIGFQGYPSLLNEPFNLDHEIFFMTKPLMPGS